ncbi:hypothetical protein F4703DRAFT_1981994 [Phycomyces blakesleeanus]
MLASELPYEITFLIANFLQPRDKVQCCLVCKSWLLASQESLFETISVKSYCNVNELVYATNPENNLLRKYCHKTRMLNIGRNICLRDRQLLALQKNLPCVQVFKWNNAIVEQYQLINCCGWNLWEKSLTNLKITVLRHDYASLSNIFVSIRSNLSRLRRLHITDQYNERALQCTFNDFELLNDQLPELIYMSLSVHLYEMKPAELLKIKYVKPAPRLKVLGCCVEEATIEWLYYLAVKYPNISTLKTFDFSRFTIDEQTSLAGNIFKQLSFPFQRLENIDVCVNMASEQVYLDFVNQLRLFNTSLKAICLSVDGISRDSMSSNNIIKSTNVFANTLQTIEIKSCPGIVQCLDLIPELVYYPHLVDLNICIKDAIVNLDVLLEKYPLLKTFSISDGVLNSSPNLPIPPTENALCDLSLSNMSISASTLKSISIFCKKLTNMELKCVDIEGSQQGATLYYCIDMSSTHFTTLFIESIQFTNVVNQDTINMFAFSLSNVSAENTWVYSWYMQANVFMAQQSKARKLNKEESKEAGEYFHNFPRNIQPKYTKDQIHDTIRFSSKDNWRDVLSNGYAIFKYGSVKNLLLETKHEK